MVRQPHFYQPGAIKTHLNLPPTWNLDATPLVTPVWANGLSQRRDAVADFRTVITAPRTIAVPLQRTVGTINFDNANRYTISNFGGLLLDVSSGSAGINVASGSHIISTPVTIADPLVVNVIRADSTLSVTSGISGPHAVNKVGPGKLEAGNVRAQALKSRKARWPSLVCRRLPGRAK